VVFAVYHIEAPELKALMPTQIRIDRSKIGRYNIFSIRWDRMVYIPCICDKRKGGFSLYVDIQETERK